MRFTEQQYEEAISNLHLARQQLEPDGHPCSICSDSGHMAYECGRNPLVAMKLCRKIAEDSEVLHETLHLLAGHVHHMGEMVGPRRVIPPNEDGS